ncbi:MAG: YgiQ family radical SAM protein [Myxococcota bacterium]|jgi:uncharacterized radical SAM protein YgiQ|nr:YgiQ family radical SAM protein [Myxococcota bacterium]
MAKTNATALLPMTLDELEGKELDVLLVTGDAYFDHPSHGAALIGRVLQAAGYVVGIVAQPDWRSTFNFAKLGRPRLFAGVTAGAVDSSLNTYTASGRKRRLDAYSPGGRSGLRPDNASIVYASRLKEAFGPLPIVLGGLEASLRRFGYFDARAGKPRRSVLLDTRADILVYGPGEEAVLEIAARLAAGRDLMGIPGTCVLLRGAQVEAPQGVELPSFAEIAQDTSALLRQALAVEHSGIPGFSKRMWQRYDEGVVLAEPPAKPKRFHLDSIAELPFCALAHPSYQEPIPALETVRFSVVSHRGCPGGCSFCSLAAHQGRGVRARSTESVLEELRRIVGSGPFRGTITDIGGPTANAFGAASKDLEKCRGCGRASCLYPRICSNLETSHEGLLELLEKARGLKGVRHVLLQSGVRHDLALQDPRFIVEVARHYTGGHLKVAPEHVHPEVLRRMRKPSIERFEELERRFLEASRAAGKEQYLVPYFIAGFPGCTPSQGDAVGQFLQGRGQKLQQVQTFIPVPGTVAAAMLACGKDENGERLTLADLREAERQKQILTQGSARPSRQRSPRKPLVSRRKNTGQVED